MYFVNEEMARKVIEELRKGANPITLREAKQMTRIVEAKPIYGVHIPEKNCTVLANFTGFTPDVRVVQW